MFGSLDSMHVYWKIVLLLFRDHTKGKRSMQQLSWRQWQTITGGFGMQHLVLQEVVMISTFLMSVPCTYVFWMDHMPNLIWNILVGDCQCNKLFLFG